MYARRCTWLITFNRHSCEAAFISPFTEVPQQTMSVLESMTLLLTEEGEKYVSEVMHEICKCV